MGSKNRKRWTLFVYGLNHPTFLRSKYKIRSCKKSLIHSIKRILSSVKNIPNNKKFITQRKNYENQWKSIIGRKGKYDKSIVSSRKSMISSRVSTISSIKSMIWSSKSTLSSNKNIVWYYKSIIMSTKGFKIISVSMTKNRGRMKMSWKSMTSKE